MKTIVERTNIMLKRESRTRAARSTGGLRWGEGVLLGLGVMMMVGCSELVTVPSSPHEIDFDDPVTLDGLRFGMIADFTYGYDSFVAQTAKFTDIFFTPSFDSGHLSRARRVATEGNASRAEQRGSTPYIGWYGPQQRAHFSAVNAQRLITDGRFPEIGEPYENSEPYALAAVFEGYAKIWMADGWCSAAFMGQGPEYTSVEVYGLAEQAFTKALEADRATAQTRQAALVGRARARLLQGDMQGVVTDASQVQPGFLWHAEYSTNSFEQRNRVWWLNWGFASASVDFRRWANLTVDDTDVADPRVSLTEEPTAAYDPAWPLWAADKVSAPNSSLVVGSYLEAQLMIAEAQLGDAAVGIINSLRALQGISVEWTPEAGTEDEILRKVIDERGRTLFLDGVRMGDLRRYDRDYGIYLWQDVTVQGEPMEDNYCFPLPTVERDSNPDLDF